MKKYILFDLDGTLTDPGEGITNSVAYALAKYGINVADRRELYPFIGPPLHQSFERLYGFSPEKAVQAVEFYREYYKDRGIFENLLYPGVQELLSALLSQGRRVILATSKPEVFAKRILEHFGIAEYFCFVGGALLDGRTDKREVIEYVLRSCEIENVTDVLMIGDRKHDVLGAAALGIKAVGVLYGYGDRKELEDAGAARIAKTVKDILPLIHELDGNDM